MKNKDSLQKWTSKNKTGQNKTDKQNFQESIYNITRLKPAETINESKKAKLLKKTAWWKNQLGKNQCYYCKEQLVSQNKLSKK